MRPLRLNKESFEKAADWAKTASGEQKRRLSEMIRTIEDGTWDTRWHQAEYAAGDDWYALNSAMHFLVLLYAHKDEVDGMEIDCGEIVTIMPPPADEERF